MPPERLDKWEMELVAYPEGEFQSWRVASRTLEDLSLLTSSDLPSFNLFLFMAPQPLQFATSNCMSVSDCCD